MKIEAAKRARFLNDRLRTTLNPIFGTITLSEGVKRLDPRTQAAVMLAIMDYEFPHLPDYPWFVDMHERGVVELDGEHYYFGVWCRDPVTGLEAEDPSSTAAERRLHIMCAADVEQEA